MEVFALGGHPKAGLAYAWAHETDEGGRRYVAVLGVDPIKSARDAGTLVEITFPGTRVLAE